MSTYPTLTLFAAFLYALGALYLKRALQEGAGIFRILFITNVLRLVIVSPFLFLGFESIDWSRWWGPLIAGTAGFLGTVLVLIAIRKGEVSVQTPLMGAKVIFVAILTFLFMGGSFTPGLWTAAGLTCLAIFIIGLPNLLGRNVSPESIFYALGSCGFFALSDMITAKEASEFGEFPFLILMALFIAAESLVLIPFFRRGITKLPRQSWKWIIIGCILLAVEEMLVLGILGFYKKPTVVNVIYSSRGIWSIGMIWFFGKWLGNYESNVGGKVIAVRLLGAILLSVAIVLVM